MYKTHIQAKDNGDMALLLVMHGCEYYALNKTRTEMGIRKYEILKPAAEIIDYAEKIIFPKVFPMHKDLKLETFNSNKNNEKEEKGLASTITIRKQNGRIKNVHRPDTNYYYYH
jgi:hypothetical protein